jgi:hypothetical protein
MTAVISKELDKFPVCFKENCLTPLEIQNRFNCLKCLKVFCCEHRLDFKHTCPFIENVSTSFQIIKYKKCSQINCNCKLTGINKFKCNTCDKEYCMSHRLDFVHNCKK